MVYSIAWKKLLKTYWMKLIIQTERAIKLLDSKFQNAFRILASRKLKQIYNSNSNINATQKGQLYIVNKPKEKLLTGNAMLVQADKVEQQLHIRSSTLTKFTISSLKIISSRSIKIQSTRTTNIFRKYYNKITSSSTKTSQIPTSKETQPHLHWMHN